MNLQTFFAYDPQDTNEIRTEKFAAFLVSGSCCLAGVVWAAMYYAVFGWSFIAFLPALFVIIVGTAILVSHISKNHHYAVYAQIICIIYITALIQWNIGGVFTAGVVQFWAFIGPIRALMFFSTRQAVFWLLLYLINLMITVIFNDYFAANGQDVAASITLFFFIMNMIFASITVFVFASYYVTTAIKEQNKANKLLNANLQQEIVLRQNEKLATLGKLSAGVATN